jgi:hypothetical protein
MRETEWQNVSLQFLWLFLCQIAGNISKLNFQYRTYFSWTTLAGSPHGHPPRLCSTADRHGVLLVSASFLLTTTVTTDTLYTRTLGLESLVLCLVSYCKTGGKAGIQTWGHLVCALNSVVYLTVPSKKPHDYFLVYYLIQSILSHHLDGL